MRAAATGHDGPTALGLAIAFVVSFPVLGLLTEVLGGEQGWAEPVVRPALLLATALGALVLGDLLPGRPALPALRAGGV